MTEDLPKNVVNLNLYQGKFENLFSLLLNEKINMNHIAKNSKDSRCVYSKKYINCSASFEYNYKNFF